MQISDVDLERIADRVVEGMAQRLPNGTPRLMDIPDAAKYMGRSEVAVRNMVKRGNLPSRKSTSNSQWRCVSRSL